jgi:Membrane protein involved in the export of O-antigen and teichoic acid
LAIRDFIGAFNSGKGNQVLFATLFARLANFIVNLSIINLLTADDYGYLSYALTIISFILPFIGGGILPGLIRYGATRGGQLEKKYYVRFALKRGMLVSLVILVVVCLIGGFLTQNKPASLPYLLVFIFQLFGLLIFRTVGAYCMLVHRNGWYARLEFTLSFLFIIGNISAAWLFGGMGYVISLVSIPLVLGIYYWFRLNLNDKVKNINFTFNTKELFEYGFYTSLGTVLSQLLYSVDILLIGNLLIDPAAVAEYRVASIIPLNLVILSLAVMTTFTVKVTRNAEKNPQFVFDFYKNYLSIFIPISLGILLFFYFGADWLVLIFGSQYHEQGDLMRIFSIGVAGGLLMRAPLGNMLPTLGYPKVNALLSLIILGINVIGSYWMLQYYGIRGAAMVTSAMFWLSGIFSLVVFLWWWRGAKR